MSINDYEKARKLGEKSYRHEIVRGRYPYLPALEEMLRGRDRLKEEKIGLCEIPISLICGTITKGRQEAFAKNYMPLLSADSEFAMKWINLIAHQKNEGIRDPVKASEFMGRFYIAEGNKRVSVLKYLEQPDILADVTRILPPEDSESKEVRVYYEFVKFFKCTSMYGIYFSSEGYYDKLAGLFGMTINTRWPDDKITDLKSCFYNFARMYAEHCGGRENSSLSFGDAFMIYLSMFKPESLLNDSDEVIRKNLGQIWPGHLSLLERLKKFYEML